MENKLTKITSSYIGNKRAIEEQLKGLKHKLRIYGLHNVAEVLVGEIEGYLGEQELTITSGINGVNKDQSPDKQIEIPEYIWYKTKKEASVEVGETSAFWGNKKIISALLEDLKHKIMMNGRQQLITDFIEEVEMLLVSEEELLTQAEIITVPDQERLETTEKFGL